MSDAYLSGLAVLSIERELAEKLDFHDVIKDFATRKASSIKISLLVKPVACGYSSHAVNDDVL